MKAFFKPFADRRLSRGKIKNQCVLSSLIFFSFQHRQQPPKTLNHTCRVIEEQPPGAPRQPWVVFFLFFFNNEDSLTQKLTARIKAAETTEGNPELIGEYSNRAELSESSQQVRLGSLFFCSSARTELISRSLSHHSSEKCHQMGIDPIDASLLPRWCFWREKPPLFLLPDSQVDVKSSPGPFEATEYDRDRDKNYHCYNEDSFTESHFCEKIPPLLSLCSEAGWGRS